MKGNSVGFLSLLVFSFLLLSSLSTSARLLLQINHDEKEFNTNGMITQADAEEDLSYLMGAEECEEKDEECVKRRVVQEAHLDYIYTQNHKP
ncbi:putative phytosulfokines 6 isoform X2 [Hibiscus syriacus]|uniref:putative phytosulfokines 6 isoform X2 n=1 Tax=Hibiscus syriacus TaxID=106335 RepID=UPI001922063D|nr:putative phytosulfokines 6 isoform X2 [Hibiscus syriacus]